MQYLYLYEIYKTTVITAKVTPNVTSTAITTETVVMGVWLALAALAAYSDENRRKKYNQIQLQHNLCCFLLRI